MSPEHLTDRDRQLTAVDGALRSVRDGGSQVLVVVGAPGTGRSSLLAAAAERAGGLGFTIAAARALPAERGLRFGVAGQLFDALPGHLPQRWTPRTWHEPDLGPAQLVRLCAALCATARDTPLAVLVDDVQWADAASDTMLRMLLRRLHHAPVALIVSGTTPWPSPVADDDAPPVDGNRMLRLGPLSTGGVREACQRICASPPDLLFAQGALALTGGNPRLLCGALTEYAREGGRPIGAPAERFAALVAEQRGAQVTSALDALPSEEVDLLRALAVAEGAVAPGVLVSLAGLTARQGDVVGELRAGELVTAQEPVLVADEVVRQRVLAGMDTKARRVLHATIAELAHRGAAPDGVVAKILLGADRPTATWAVAVLRRAALTALAEGADADAVALTECALGGQLTAHQRADLFLDLAAAVVAQSPDASDRALALGITAAGSGPDGLARRLRAADLLVARGNAAMAVRTITGRLDALAARPEPRDPADTAERTTLIAMHALASNFLHNQPSECPRRIPPPADLPDDPVAAGVVAYRLGLQGVDVERTVVLAKTALTVPYAEQPLILPRLTACTALLLADHVTEAESELTALLIESRRRRLRVPAAWALVSAAALCLHCGRLDEAAAYAADGETELPLAAWHPLIRPMPAAYRAMIELRRGNLSAAERMLAGLSPSASEHGFAWAYLLYARGLLALQTGDPAAALRDLWECGRRLNGNGWHNPMLLRWRPLAAQALRQTGEDDGLVRRLLAEERRLAARWGIASAVGAADLAAATTADGPGEAVRLATAAERILRGTPVRLLHAEALVTLAMLRLDAGEPDGTALLARARLTALELNAGTLIDRIDRHVRAGAVSDEPSRQASEPPVGPSAPSVLSVLSVAEARVVELAATGLSNPEIAGTLSVTRRTVELHLTNAYRKLGVSRRAQLADLVAARRPVVEG